MRRLLFLVILWLPLACAGSGTGSTPPVDLAAGRCIKGSFDIENVPCDDPTAEYRLVRSALSIADPQPACDGGEVLLEIQRTFTDGPLAGGSQPAEPWCVVPL